MASFNRVILVGNLTRDPQLKYLPSGTPVCEIGLAVSERIKNANGEWVDQPLFVDITLWNRTAEVASEYLSKGAPVLIEGRLKLDTWETDGQKRSKLKVIGDRMQMLGSRQGEPGGGGGGGGGGGPRGARPASRSSGGDEFGGGEPLMEQYAQPDGPPADDIPF
jgi:single-strand DNA-binding protein